MTVTSEQVLQAREQVVEAREQELRARERRLRLRQVELASKAAREQVDTLRSGALIVCVRAANALAMFSHGLGGRNRAMQFLDSARVVLNMLHNLSGNDVVYVAQTEIVAALTEHPKHWIPLENDDQPMLEMLERTASDTCDRYGLTDYGKQLLKRIEAEAREKPNSGGSRRRSPDRHEGESKCKRQIDLNRH